MGQHGFHVGHHAHALLAGGGAHLRPEAVARLLQLLVQPLKQPAIGTRASPIKALLEMTY